MHHDSEIYPSTEKKKPGIIIYYNLTKRGVDVANSMSAEYSITGETTHWLWTLFFATMYIAVPNAFIAFKSNGQTITSCAFLKDFAKHMLQLYLTQQGNLSREIQQLAAKQSGYEAEPK